MTFRNFVLYVNIAAAAFSFAVYGLLLAKALNPHDPFLFRKRWLVALRALRSSAGTKIMLATMTGLSFYVTVVYFLTVTRFINAGETAFYIRPVISVLISFPGIMLLSFFALTQADERREVRQAAEELSDTVEEIAAMWEIAAMREDLAPDDQEGA